MKKAMPMNSWFVDLHLHPSELLFLSVQLEDVEVTVSDHVQKVLKSNWSASWEEIGGENELEDTYTLSIPSLEGPITSLSVFQSLGCFV